MDEKNEMKNLIQEYITETECNYECDGIVFDCYSCSCLKDCYIKSCERCNNEFAESIDYGGYDTAENFWEQFD